MRMPRTLAVLVLLIAALAVSCGSDQDDAVSVATATAAPATATATKPPATASTAAVPAPVARCATAAKAMDASYFKLVDKQRGLDADYVPADLVALPDRLAVPGFAGQRMRREPADAMVRMLDAADAQGIELRVRSSYRSY